MKRNARLRILRILNGLTQEQLSVRSGSPRGSISIWEKGNNAPSHDAVPQIAEALNAPAGYLMYAAPLLHTAVWQVVAPAARHLPQMANYLADNLPAFFEENKITRFWRFESGKWRIIFLAQSNQPYRFLLLHTPEMDDCMSEALQAPEDCSFEGECGPPVLLAVRSLATMSAVHLERIVDMAELRGCGVDRAAIMEEFLRIKECDRGKGCSGVPLTADQLVVPGHYWWLPACFVSDSDKPEHWSIVTWHPADSSRRKSGLFVGPLPPPVFSPVRCEHD